MKTKEELNALKAETEALSKKLAELTEEELDQVNGGGFFTDLWNSVQKQVEEALQQAREVKGSCGVVINTLHRPNDQ